ncbi:MAG: hypothetical protein AAFZ18_00605 [Myxococcota bacterium]
MQASFKNAFDVRKLSASTLGGLAALSMAVGGCGLEGLLAESGDTDHPRPRTTLRGTVEAAIDLTRAEFVVLTSDGQEIEIFDFDVDGNTFDLALDEGRYPNARLSVAVGGFNLLALLPEIVEVDGTNERDIDRGFVPTSVSVSPDSTIQALVVMGKVTGLGRRLQALDPVATQNTLAAVGDLLATNTSTLATVRQVVSTLLDRADSTLETSEENPRVFQWPEYQPEGQPLTRALIEGSPVVNDPIDFGSLGTASLDLARLRFDQLIAAAAEGVQIQECLDPSVIRVVMEVDFNPGRLDGSCNEINRFKWVRDEPGKQMFFVGGVHETSPVQDTTIDAMLGNQGSWSPNTVGMFDDGTNGDVVGGDNVWTISFDLPRGLRFGYKYTWGQQGDLWTGSEEWPGNQRIMEVTDFNGDGLIYRRDNFGDESTNKDLANLRIATGGSVDFIIDADDDGVPDAAERHDLDNDCRPDPLITPTGVGPATVPPLDDGTCPVGQ